MLFGTETPLWKYVLGIITLSIVAQRAAVGVMIHLSGGSFWLVAGLMGQAFAGVLIAIGLFAQKNRAIVGGAGVALAALVVTSAAGLSQGGTGVALRTLGGGGVILVLALIFLVFRRGLQEERTPREYVNNPVLSAAQAENFASQKPNLFGGDGPSEVSVSEAEAGRWEVRLGGQRHQVQAMTEPQWQAWLKQHPLDAKESAPHAG